MELHDWLAQDFVPINHSWAAIETVGAAEAVAAAAVLLGACADLVDIATQPGEARGSVASTIKGLSWTAAQEASLKDATDRLVGARAAFIRVVRDELGAEVVTDRSE
jgi:hypothetical protein